MHKLLFFAVLALSLNAQLDKNNSLIEHYSVIESTDLINIVIKDNIDIKEAKKLIPPLIKGYLRLGAYIGDGAVLDEQFSTTDIFIILKTEQVTRRYKMHYEAKNVELNSL